MTELEQLLQQSITIPQHKVNRFFKTAPGDYAHHDQFLGITNPTLRTLAKQYQFLSFAQIKTLLLSPYNEKRFLGLIILVNQYQKADLANKETIYQFYLEHIDCVNNWNLVDTSAHLIIGAHLFDKDKKILHDLTKSPNLWHRRIAIVATWYFIRQNQFESTATIAKQLINDKHDLIHKATGWMLREAGKKDLAFLLAFLDEHAYQMPRTMLRYAIEKLSDSQKSIFLKKNAS